MSLLCCVAAPLDGWAAAGDMTTVAGTGTAGFSGDGSLATLAALRDPMDVAFGPSGNLFIADGWNYRIRMVDQATGVIESVAGSGWGDSGDGELATQAKCKEIGGVIVDLFGNIYFSDIANGKIRKVDGSSGLISTLTSGIASPHGLALDSAQTLYAASQTHHRIYRIETNGSLTVVAGSTPLPAGYDGGFGGDDGLATDALLSRPRDVTFDLLDNMYIADSSNGVIRRVDASTGYITTVVGPGLSGVLGDNGPASGADLSGPSSVVVDGSGNIYISDKDNNRVRLVDAASGIITTVAGTGARGYSGDGSPATTLQIANAAGIALDADACLYIADTFNDRVRRVESGTPPGQALVAANFPNSATTADPINTYTGEFFEQHAPDLDLGGAMPLQFRRYYASGLLRAGKTGSLGDNWTHNFEWDLSDRGDEVIAHTDRGRTLLFAKTVTRSIGSGNDDVEENSTGTLSMGSSDLELTEDNSRGQQIIGLLFRDINLAPGAHVATASIQFTVDEITSGSTTLTVRAEAVGDPADFVDVPFDLSSRSTTAASVTWTPADWTLVGEAGADQQTPDLSAIIQEVIDRPDWSPHNAISIIITGSGTRTAESYDGESAKAPVLSISLDGYAPTTGPVPYQLQVSGSVFTLYDPEAHLFYAFDATGLLSHIDDGRGNSHALTYSGRDLVEVSDGLGRSLSFSYSGGYVDTVSDGTRSITFGYTASDLTLVTDAEGAETTYNYDSGGLLISWARAEGNRPYSQTYNADGKVSAQTDAAGNTLSLSYAGSDTTITDGASNTVVHSHTPSGELASTQDRAGQSVVISSTAAGRRETITDRLGSVTRMSYHPASGQLTSRTEADGSTTHFDYGARDAAGISVFDLTGIRYADGSGESFAYDAVGNLLSYSDRAGFSETSTYDTHGQPLTLTNAAGGQTSRSYSSDASLVTTTDPAGNQTNFFYDGLGRVSQIVFADGGAASLTYDHRDAVLSLTNESGHSRTWAYDRNGNLSTHQDALGATTAFAYDGNDRVLSTTDALGGVTRRSYDRLGRVDTTTDANGNTTVFGFDIHNRLTSVTDPMAGVWTASYDLEGVITSSADPLLNTTSYQSDSMGRITQVTSPLGAVSKIGYDVMGQVRAATDSLGHVTRFGTDERGLLASVSLANGTIRTSYTHNALGQLTTITDPNGNDWLRDYDNSGRQTAATDPLQRTQTLTYDERNRVDTVTYPSGLGSVELSYDAAGNLIGHIFSDGTTTSYSYDANNRRVAATGMTRAYDANGHISNSNGIAITRDAGGRIASMLLAPGKAITYTYDANDRLITVGDWAAGETHFSYDAAGRMTRIARPNSVDTSQTWDEDSRLAGIDESGLSSIALTRDAWGQITSATRDMPLAASASTLQSRADTFDAAAQIVGATYDAVGRLLGDGADSYTWNLASLLMDYTVQGVSAAATYDAESRRISRSEGGTTRDYVWNDALGLASISVEKQDGVDLRYYVHSPDGALLYSVDASSGARFFYHYDEMGNTRFVSDDSGTVVASYAYSPFGEMTASTGALDNPFTWQGKFGLMDEGNGLYYVRTRYYDSRAGRFVSRDAIKNSGPQKINPYAFALNNPQRFIDVTGGDPEDFKNGYVKMFIANSEFPVWERVEKYSNYSGGSIGSLQKTLESDLFGKWFREAEPARIDSHNAMEFAKILGSNKSEAQFLRDYNLSTSRRFLDAMRNDKLSKDEIRAGYAKFSSEADDGSYEAWNNRVRAQSSLSLRRAPQCPNNPGAATDSSAIGSTSKPAARQESDNDSVIPELAPIVVIA